MQLYNIILEWAGTKNVGLLLELHEVEAIAIDYLNPMLESRVMVQGKVVELMNTTNFFVFKMDADQLPLALKEAPAREVRNFLKVQHDTLSEKGAWQDLFIQYGSIASSDFVLGPRGSGKLGRLLQAKQTSPTLDARESTRISNNSIRKIKDMKSESRSLTAIFISHASKDQALVDLFVHSFLRLGLEVPSRDIFCTSLAGMGIPSGEDFRNAIKDKILGAELIFLLITPNYQQSQMCLAEMGAAWVLGKRVIPIIVPPIDYGTAGILVTPNQIMKLDDASNLDQLKTDIEAALGIKDNVHLATWGKTRDKFLSDLQAVIAASAGKK